MKPTKTAASLMRFLSIWTSKLDDDHRRAIVDIVTGDKHRHGFGTRHTADAIRALTPKSTSLPIERCMMDVVGVVVDSLRAGELQGRARMPSAPSSFSVANARVLVGATLLWGEITGGLDTDTIPDWMERMPGGRTVIVTDWQERVDGVMSQRNGWNRAAGYEHEEDAEKTLHAIGAAEDASASAAAEAPSGHTVAKAFRCLEKDLDKLYSVVSDVRDALEE